MRVMRIAAFVSILAGATSLWAMAAEPPSLSGVVRDAAGKPLAGARVMLTRNEEASASLQTTTDSSGKYRFAGLVNGKYELVAELDGYVSKGPLAVRIEGGSTPPAVDLTLEQSSTAPIAAHSPLEFQSTGIRGLIDPGGYSASTSSAASGLVRGIADIRRTDRHADTADLKAWPCGLEAQLRAAVTEHPEQGEPNRRLGQFYLAHGQPGKAVPLLKRATQIDASDAVAVRELAMALMQDGEFEDARSFLLPLVSLQAGSDLHQLLARAYEGSGMFQQAAQEYRAAQNKEPSEENIFGEGYELILAGSVADGMGVFDTGIKMYPRSISLRIGAGTAQCLLGKTSAGLRSFLDATDFDPSDPRPYSFLVSVSGISSDESDRVQRSLKRFLDREPANGSVSFYYALALSREHSAANAVQIEALLKRAIQLDPNLSRAHLLLGEIYAERKDYRDAVAEYEAAVRLAQDLSEAHYRLAMAYKDIGRSEQAAREMEVFRLTKKSQPSGSEGQGIDMTQLISVMDLPGQIPETQCPAP